MRDRVGTLSSVATAVLYVAVLTVPYVFESAREANTYYRWGLVNPLYAGILVVGVAVILTAVHLELLPARIGTGLSFLFGLIALLVTAAWAITAQLDIFEQSAWVPPLQQYALVTIAGLVVLAVTYDVVDSDFNK